MRYLRGSLAVLAIAGLAVLAACGTEEAATSTPTATSGPDMTPTTGDGTPPATITDGTPTATAAGPVSLDELIEAAEAEGELNVLSGFSTQAQIPGFQEAFPDITVNFTQLRAPDLVSRLPQEQQANVFEWDIVHIGGSGGVDPTIPRTLFEPVRDKLLPELTADELYISDFDTWWMDDDETRFKLHHRTAAAPGTFFDANRNVAPDFADAEDFFDPALRGKICSFDPRIESGTDAGLAQMMAKFGEDWLRRFLDETELVFSTNGTQLAQDLIAGKYAVCIGASMDDFRREGAAPHVERVPISNPERALHPDFDWMPVSCCGTGKDNPDGPVDGFMTGGAAANMVQIGKNAPNPNAARLYVNWLLTREGAMAFMDPADTECSIRADLHHSVCVEQLNSIPQQFTPIDPNGSYTEDSLASTVQIRLRVRELAREILGGF
jgi:ABC-type Fe3+ transport system substrate-binding protein